MSVVRFVRGLSVMAAALTLAGCVTIAPVASPTAPPTPAPTATPAPTTPPTPIPTVPPTPTPAPTATPTGAPTLPPTPKTAPPTAPPTAVLDPNESARYGSLDPLRSGFLPDPRSVTVVSGGPIDVSYLGEDCTGFAEPNPDYEIRYDSGPQPFLRVYFVAEAPGDDATLVINDADNQWHCSDDEYGTTNPSIDLPSADGWYDIWIGSYSPSEYISGTLYITELEFNHP